MATKKKVSLRKATKKKATKTSLKCALMREVQASSEKALQLQIRLEVLSGKNGDLIDELVAQVAKKYVSSAETREMIRRMAKESIENRIYDLVDEFMERLDFN